jgi:16S rRNA (cytidine1402-2'-O)-methyltransferase
MNRGALFLLPTLLGETPPEAVLPAATLDLARRIDYFLAENAKSARAFLKAVGHPRAIGDLRIVEIGHRPDSAHIDAWLQPIVDEGRDAAVVSEAGCPGIADPGAEIVARAHARGVAVRPLVGPSSILLTLMASGLNGQRFRFVGYLPHDAGELAAALRALEHASRDGETQIFIETPYRNQRLLETILRTCAPTTRLTLAVELTTPRETVVTRTIDGWRALPPAQRPPLERRPTVFALAAPARSAHARR